MGAYEFKSFSQDLKATPIPKPVPKNTGHPRLLKNNSENTDPITSPPAKTEEMKLL